ncbi:diacylglycerol/lipid kinase family protein [Gillisia sp. Q332]|uniref:diacylglycerol/lipid kinase family protein n=1 Tax=Gillisia xinjiangensis TaxID=3384765 RepID=UPI00391DF29E
MKNILIVHNPTAGDAEHSKQFLVDFFKDTGMVTTYVSSDEAGWEQSLRNKPDAIYLAGGDGTVHSLAIELLKIKNPDERPPVLLQPLGTANNIATTLSIKEKEVFLPIDPNAEKRKFDCGKVSGIKGDGIFLEGVGMGIFPELIAEMKKQEVNPEEKLDRSLNVLLKIVKKYKAQKAKIELDGFTVKGSFLMVEVMNIRYIGPKLHLAPDANPGDGYLNLVMIPENKREELEAYVKSLIAGKNSYDLRKMIFSLRVQKLKIKWKGSKVHLDDALDEDYSGEKIKMKILPGALTFLK